MKKAVVLMSVQHSLMDVQKDLLGYFDDYDVMDVPADGWDFGQLDSVAKDLIGKMKDMKDDGISPSVVFVSPIPYLMQRLQKASVTHNSYDLGSSVRFVFGVGSFQAPKRKKVQKGDKVFYTIPKDGWKLIMSHGKFIVIDKDGRTSIKDKWRDY